jgi:protocatechuate 3,4-dioxygenase beta subunit
VQAGNGNSADTSNLDATFLRGIQETDSDGVVQFQTVFPGHYSGRTTHHHVVAHLDVTVHPNNTITGGTVAHVGQLFYDQSLIAEVEATYPYNTNTIALTTNAEDHVFGEQETAGMTSDPVFEYVLLGDDLSDGLFGWITIAVNVSATYDPSYSE